MNEMRRNYILGQSHVCGWLSGQPCLAMVCKGGYLGGVEEGYPFCPSMELCSHYHQSGLKLYRE